MMFEASATFRGARPGCVFTTRKGLTGYYCEVVEAPAEPATTKKRPREDETVQEILARADDVDVSELTPATLKKLLLAFEKKITRNQQLRAKYADEPAKFVESEVDLDDAIKELGVVAAAPELYPIIVESGGAASIVGLLAHENTDISASAVTLLYDLTDAEALEAAAGDEAGVEACAVSLVEAIEAESGLELLVQNLERFDEANAEEVQAVHNTLGIFENVTEISRAGARPDLVNRVCESTSLHKYLVERCRRKPFDAIKLYATELLAIIGAFSESAAAALGRARTKDGADGVDAVLQACAHYRRRSPQGEDEEECVENLFDTLAAAMTSSPAVNVPLFVAAEGVELMLRCAREGRVAAACALRVVDAAMTAATAAAALDETFDASVVARRLVDKGGLKVVFPALMGRGAARAPKLDRRSAKTRRLKRKRRSADEQRACDEHVLSVVAQLCAYANEDRPDEARKRLVAKFLEADQEKLRRVLDLYASYADRTSDAAAEPLEDLDDLDEDQRRLLEHAHLLEAGLHALRLAAHPIAFAAVHSPTCRAVVVAHLKRRNAGPDHVATTLGEEAEDLEPGVDDDDDDKAPKKKNPAMARILIDWAEALLAIPTDHPGPTPAE